MWPGSSCGPHHCHLTRDADTPKPPFLVWLRHALHQLSVHAGREPLLFGGRLDLQVLCLGGVGLLPRATAPWTLLCEDLVLAQLWGQPPRCCPPRPLSSPIRPQRQTAWHEWPKAAASPRPSCRCGGGGVAATDANRVPPCRAGHVVSHLPDTAAQGSVTFPD